MGAAEDSCRQLNIEATNSSGDTHYESGAPSSGCAIMVEIRFKSDKFCYALRYVVLVPCRRKPLPRKGAIDADQSFEVFALHTLTFGGPADNQTHCVEECLDEAIEQAWHFMSFCFVVSDVIPKFFIVKNTPLIFDSHDDAKADGRS